jgi:hypothetical protein
LYFLEVYKRTAKEKQNGNPLIHRKKETKNKTADLEVEKRKTETKNTNPAKAELSKAATHNFFYP